MNRFIIIVIFGLVVLVVYTKMMKKLNAQDIVQLGGASDIHGLMEMQSGFLHAWADGLRNKELTFNFKGGKYLTKGGRATA